jgi:glycosyltransferase involved in cell wall biosynthesis
VADIVLFVHQSAEMYGSDKVLLLLAQGVKQQGRFWPVVILPSQGPLHTELVASGIEVHIGEVVKLSRAAFKPFGLLRLIGQAVRAIGEIDKVVQKRAVAIVHSNTLAVLAGALWGRLRRKRHLWHVHEIIESPKFVSRSFPFLVKLLSDRVISNSTVTEKWLLSMQPALASRSTVILNGLPPVAKPTEEVIQRFRASIDASGEDIVVTLAGRINRWKGQELLIRAAIELQARKRIQFKRFVIVGGPAPGLEMLPAQLQEMVTQAGLKNHFVFLPFADDILPVWFGTDIAVVPSTEPEPFGMVAIEAMAAAVPVVAAGHGGLLDIVVDSQTGLLFTPRDASALADAIDLLAGDKALRASFGTAGASRQLAQFSVASQVEKLVSVYEGML